MSIQSQLDNGSIAMLPRIVAIIERAKSYEANQMRCRTLREIGDSKIAIDNMNPAQLYEFQEELIETFNCFDWI